MRSATFAAKVELERTLIIQARAHKLRRDAYRSATLTLLGILIAFELYDTPTWCVLAVYVRLTNNSLAKLLNAGGAQGILARACCFSS